VGAEDPVQPRDVVPAREEDEDAALAAKLRLEDVLEQVDDEVVIHLRKREVGEVVVVAWRVMRRVGLDSVPIWPPI
jgi:hypothetical protein